MKSLQQIGLVVITSSLLMVESVSLAQQGCYQNPAGGPCATDQLANLTNGCIAITYSPSTSKYCDVRDGECGKTACQVIQVSVTEVINKGTPTSPPGDPTIVYCEPGEDLPPVYAGKQCPVATLSGSQCGYCPPG
jgi:hypothetical protein